MKRVGERSKRYGSLVGSAGVAITPIDLSGNVTVNDVNLAVYSEKPIPQGASVRIVRVDPDKIIVERIENDDT